MLSKREILENMILDWSSQCEIGVTKRAKQEP